MESSEEIKKAEQRGYSRGYASGVRAGRYKAAVRDDVPLPTLALALASAAPSPQEAKPLTPPMVQVAPVKDGRRQLLESLADELETAIAQGRLHLWASTAHSVVDYLAERYKGPVSDVSALPPVEPVAPADGSHGPSPGPCLDAVS